MSMMHKSKIPILFFLQLSVTLAASPTKLLIVSFDGFRHDYVTAANTPTLMALRQKSSWADRMVNVFPTKTFPNHHSIATGVYVETHGVLGSHIHQEHGPTLEYSQQMFEYNVNITPIWILNQRHGMHSGSMMWLGGELLYQNTKATFTVVYEKKMAWEEKVTTVIDWFKHAKTPVNLVMVYFHQPDYASHRFGTGSAQVLEQIKKIDGIVGYLDNKLLSSGLEDVNVFLLSDHGMMDVPFQNILDVTPGNNPQLQPVKDWYKTTGSSPVTQVVTEQGKEAEVFKAFKSLAADKGHFKVFLKDALPASWHVRNNTRMSPILIVADPGYGFQDLLEYKPRPGGTLGVHGYDNSETSMHPFFMAWGPMIKPNQRLPVFNNVDLYSLWCRMLALNDTQSSGRFKNVKAVLKVKSSVDRVTESTIIILAGFVTTLMMNFN